MNVFGGKSAFSGRKLLFSVRMAGIGNVAVKGVTGNFRLMVDGFPAKIADVFLEETDRCFKGGR